MDFFDTLKIIVRRWKIVIPGLILTAIAVVGAYGAAGSQYHAMNSLLLVVPTPPANVAANNGQPTDACSRNPFCGSGNLTNLGNVVALSMSDEARSTPILKDHPGASYTVILSDDQRSPIIVVNAVGSSQAEALATLKSATVAVTVELARRQREIGVPADSLIDSEPVVVARSAAIQSGGKTRGAITTLALGVILTLGSVFLVENISRSRKRKQVARAAATDPELQYAEPASGPLSLVGGAAPVAGAERGAPERNGETTPAAPARDLPLAPAAPQPDPVNTGVRAQAEPVKGISHGIAEPAVPSAPKPSAGGDHEPSKPSSRFGRLTS